jgi:hypothetical protein
MATWLNWTRSLDLIGNMRWLAGAVWLVLSMFYVGQWLTQVKERREKTYA